MVQRPPIALQGKTVIEQNAHGEYLIMHPDGCVRIAVDKADAEKHAKAWYRTALGRATAIGVGEIEWRGIDDQH